MTELDCSSSVAAPAPATAGSAPRLRPHAKLIALLALGHMAVDLNPGSIPALLPLLKQAHGLSYAQAATVVLVGNVTSSLLQPLFGWFADRATRRWLLPLAVFLAGVGLSLLGVAGGYLELLGLVAITGLGVAAWHPEGFSTATGVAGDRKATALSWFSLGGNLGYALGPPVVTALVAAFTLKGTLGMLVPTALVGGLFLAAMPRIERAAARGSRASAAVGVDQPWAMALLIVLVALRSWAALGFTTFVPFYYVDCLGADPRSVGPLLFVFLGAGAFGTVLAGPVADRVGPLAFMRWALLGAAPFGLLFLHTSGAAAVVVLGLFGAVLTSSFSVSVVLGQAYLPRRQGMASGLVVGFANGAGGLGVTALGWVADHHGVPAALAVSAAMPLLAFAAARFLPAPRAER